MKRKFSSMGRVAIALVLALSLSLVMTVPVVAAAVGTPTVTLDSYLAGDTDVEHTISFDIGVSLAMSEVITITFATDYETPTTWVDGDITLDGDDVLATSVSTNGDVVTITLRASIVTGDNPVVVVFTSAADINNPIEGDYTLSVATTVETVATSAEYTLYDEPTVGVLSPVKGNVGDTMWVEVTGTNFAGTAATNASVTTLDFGAGITVVSSKYISDISIDCLITINATGTPLVVGTTATVTGTVGQTFTANAAGTPQVDVWETYTPTTDDIFVAGTLGFEGTYDTITLAEDACNNIETVIVHADTYVETTPLTIGQAGTTFQSLSGAAATTIDVSAAQDINNPTTSIGIAVTVTGVTISGFTIIGVPTVTDSTATGFTYSSGAYPTIKATATADDLTVQDCIFTAPSGEVGHEALLLDGDDGQTGVEFLDNEVTNYIYGITARVVVDELLVDGNTFNQTSYLEDPDGWPPAGVPIYLCKGVQFQSGARAGTGLTATDNTFTGPATLESEFDTSALKDIFAISDFSSGTSLAPVITDNTISNYFTGIFTWANGTISDNDIDACTVGINVGQRRGDSTWVGTATDKDLTISENDITDSLNRGIWVQSTTGLGTGAVIVKYNTIAGNANYGLTNEIVSGTATAGSTTTLTDTSLDWDLGAPKLGFLARGVAVDDRVVNVTTGLTARVSGIAAYKLTLGNPETDFTFSAGDSYRVEAQVDVDSAKYNWWGHIGGPSADAGVTSPLGSGDVLSSNMSTGAGGVATVYDPWLTETQATVIADGVRSYGSNALALEEGWNTLSVPCGLKSTANTFGEIIGLGTYLVSEGTTQNYLGGYWYDASTSPTQWKGIDNDTTLVPGKGFYVKMSSATSFPVLYFDGSVSLPAYDMYAGWNLIGSAFGIDKVGASTWAVGASETGTHVGGDDVAAVMTDNTAAFTVNELVGLTIVNVDDGSSGVITANTATTVTVSELIGGTDQEWDNNDVYLIAYTKAKMGIGAALISIDIPGSVVISPSVPGQAAGWAAAVDDTGTYRMYVGEAYWVFMDANGTLAGFEVTPFCFTPGDMP